MVASNGNDKPQAIHRPAKEFLKQSLEAMCERAKTQGTHAYDPIEFAITTATLGLIEAIDTQSLVVTKELNQVSSLIYHLFKEEANGKG